MAKATPIDPALVPTAKNKDERRLEEIQAALSNSSKLTVERNKLLTKLAASGSTHRELAARLSRGAGHPITEDTVQKGIRTERETK